MLRSRPVLTQAARGLNMIGLEATLREDEYQKFQDQVKIKPIAGSRIIDIIGMAETAPMAAAIANQVTVAFVETTTEARNASTQRILDRVQSQVRELDEEIRQKEDEVKKTRQEHLITGEDTGLSAIQRVISVIEEKLTQTQMTRLELDNQRRRIQQMLSTGRGMGEDELAIREVDQNAQVVALTRQISESTQKEASLARAYLPGHPQLRNLRLHIADLQTKLLDQKHVLMQGLLGSTTERYAETVRQEESYLAMLNKNKEKGVELTQQHQAYVTQTEDLEMSKRFKTDSLARVRQFKLQEGLAESPVEVIDPAPVPTKTAGLQKSQQAGFILLLGLLFSLAFILALDRLATPAAVFNHPASMTIPANMAAVMGQPGIWGPAYWPAGAMPMNASHDMATATVPTSQTPVSAPGADVETQQADPAPEPMQMVSSPHDSVSKLGCVSDIDLGKSNYNDLAFATRCRIVHADQSCPEASAFRDMSNSLIQHFARTRQSLVITSSKRQEGKTTCACNLGLALAKSGRKVLVIDANLQSPALHRIFADSQGKPGLREVLFDIDNLDKALVDPEIATLTILPSDPQSGFSGGQDLKNLDGLIHKLKQRYDWILFDAGTLQQQVCKDLLQVVGKCLYVTTSADSAAHAAIGEQIESCGAVCIGFVENAHVPGAHADQPGETASIQR